MHKRAYIKCLYTNVCCLGKGQKEPELCIHRQSFMALLRHGGGAPIAGVPFVLGSTPQRMFCWRGKKNQEVRRVMKALWGPAMFVSLVSLKAWSRLDLNTTLVLSLLSPRAELLQVSVLGSDQSLVQEECGVGAVVGPSTAGSSAVGRSWSSGKGRSCVFQVTGFPGEVLGMSRGV